MDSDQTLAYSIVLVVLLIVLPLMKWRSNSKFKAYLKSQLHPTELARLEARLETTEKDIYVGAVFSDAHFYEIYTNGKGGFYFKKGA